MGVCLKLENRFIGTEFIKINALIRRNGGLGLKLKIELGYLGILIKLIALIRTRRMGDSWIRALA